MNLVFGHDATVNEWIWRKHGYQIWQSPAVTAGAIDADGVLRGALVLVWKTQTTAEMSVFGRVSNDVAKAWFAYVFGPASVHRLEARTSKRNQAIKRAAPKFGFRFERVERDYYGPGLDGIAYVMTPHTCRWIDHGQLTKTASAA